MRKLFALGIAVFFAAASYGEGKPAKLVSQKDVSHVAAQPLATCTKVLNGGMSVYETAQQAMDAARAWIASKTSIIADEPVVTPTGMCLEPGMTCYVATITYQTSGKCL